MYLCGPPLHVLAMTLLDELHRALPGTLRVEGQDGTVEVSFSAGVTKRNAAWMAGPGVAPITVSRTCSSRAGMVDSSRCLARSRRRWPAMAPPTSGRGGLARARSRVRRDTRARVAAYVATCTTRANAATRGPARRRGRAASVTPWRPGAASRATCA